eukprot:TCALIF_13538-PA protein Name:"Similar to ORF V Enzymatic polyprotein (Cestrum yellow leaf curling virus)" AED:0.28 eAED:0.37 QI:4/0/0/1/0/0/4/0/259
MIVVSKKNGDPLICFDYKKLNEHVVRPTHPFPPHKEAIANMPEGAWYFSTFDTKNIYRQISLTKTPNASALSQPSAGFNPSVLLKAFRDVYNEINDRTFAGLPNFRKMVDDLLQVSNTFQEHITDVGNVILRCRDNKVTLNPSKFYFGQLLEVDHKPLIPSLNDYTMDNSPLLASNSCLRNWPCSPISYGTRIVVPKKARHSMLTLLHIPHQGMDWSKQHGRQIFYWSGMSSDIENHVASCEKCSKYLPSQKQEPLIPT